MGDILVTGGAGFIGNHVAVYLRHQGHSVLALDDLSRASAPAVTRLRSERIPLVKRDIRSALRSTFARHQVEAVVHLAALTSVPESFRVAHKYHDVNVGGTLNLLLSCREARVQQFVNISSAAVYGPRAKCPVPETATLAPASPYGATKAAAEAYTLSLPPPGGVATNLRLFNVFGKGQNPDYAGVIDIFARTALASKPLTIDGDGSQTRDFIHVQDVAGAVEKVLDRRASGTFNVGTGTAISINELAKQIQLLARDRLRSVTALRGKGTSRRVKRPLRHSDD